MLFRLLTDSESSTHSYLLADEESREAVLIDPVLEQVERDSKLIAELGLKLVATLETHVHADHITGAQKHRELHGSQAIVSAHAGAACHCADRQVREGDLVQFGRHALRVLETPGHTDSCISFYDEENQRVFTGDALLIRGCGRTDFQQGNPHTLYHSVRDKLFALPGATLVYPGHDYQGRTASSIEEERQHNARLRDGISEEQFVEIMGGLKLAYPKKIDVAVPANLACGTSRQDPPPLPWAPIELRADGVPEVTKEWLALHHEGVVVVDVREAAELADLPSIDGAIHVPLGTLATWAAAAPHNKSYVVACRSGARSGRAVLHLLSEGFAHVASLRGGMLAWPHRNVPSVR